MKHSKIILKGRLLGSRYSVISVPTITGPVYQWSVARHCDNTQYMSVKMCEYAAREWIRERIRKIKESDLITQLL